MEMKRLNEELNAEIKRRTEMNKSTQAVCLVHNSSNSSVPSTVV
jgi:hypothetical protein